MLPGASGKMLLIREQILYTSGFYFLTLMFWEENYSKIKDQFPVGHVKKGRSQEEPKYTQWVDLVRPLVPWSDIPSFLFPLVPQELSLCCFLGSTLAVFLFNEEASPGRHLYKGLSESVSAGPWAAFLPGWSLIIQLLMNSFGLKLLEGPLAEFLLAVFLIWEVFKQPSCCI